MEIWYSDMGSRLVNFRKLVSTGKCRELFFYPIEYKEKGLTRVLLFAIRDLQTNERELINGT